MSTSQAIFATWLRTRIAPPLRERGFSGGGQDFHRRVGRNWQAINIQRSKWSNADELEFTINLGTASAAVLAAAREDPDEPQREVVCHWRIRIGALLPRRDDYWWKVRSRASEGELDALANEVGGALLDLGLPGLDRMVTDEQILEAYLEDDRAASSPAGQDVVGPLLRSAGPRSQLAAYMQRLDAADPPLPLYSITDFAPKRMGPGRTTKALEKLDRRGWEPRQQALFDLAHAAPTPNVVAAVLGAFDDPVAHVRMAAAHAAGHLGIAESLDSIVEMVAMAPRHIACYSALAAVRLADRLDAPGRARLIAAIRARHADAVGHERPLLGHVLRELGAA